MSYQETVSALGIASLKDLRKHEKEIVRRIGATRNGGHLLLLDPQRLLQQIDVKLTSEAVKEIQKAYPDFLVGTGGEGAYDRVANSNAKGEVQVTILGLFPKESA
jgi:hypothetical protein